MARPRPAAATVSSALRLCNAFNYRVLVNVVWDFTRCKRLVNVTVTFAIMVEIAFVCKRIFNVILLVDLT